jgi:hypothetical protein
MRNIVVLGGSSHPQLTEYVISRESVFREVLIGDRTICNHLGIPKAKVLLDKFKGGETRVEIEESVRGKDVFIIQSGGGKGTKLLLGCSHDSGTAAQIGLDLKNLANRSCRAQSTTI